MQLQVIAVILNNSKTRNQQPSSSIMSSFKTLFALFVFALVAISQVSCEEVASRNNGGSSGTGATVIVSGTETVAPALAVVFLLGAFVQRFVNKN